MSIIDINSPGGAAAIIPQDVKMVIVHDGSRGPKGEQGVGVPGPDGDPIVVLGPWVSGTVYAPLDAVTDRSSGSTSTQSLWIQKSSVPAAVSTTRPFQDQTRWSEIGVTDISSVTGAIWTISQAFHPFTKVGQPAAFDGVAGKWLLGDNRDNGVTVVAVVRQVIDDTLVVLQSSGEIADIDPTIITPSGVWEQGKVYYVSATTGFIQTTPPADGLIQPLLVATQNHQTISPGVQAGVVIPSRPTPQRPTYYLVGQKKFYFTASAGQTTISGLDDAGNLLTYEPGSSTEVFTSGLNVSELGGYTASDGVSIIFGTPLSAGDEIEVWTIARPLDAVVPSTAVKLDNIEGLFNGVRTSFPLTYNAGASLAVQSTANVSIWVDGNTQEPGVDFNVVEDPSAPTTASLLEFVIPPQAGERFWGLTGIPTGGFAAAAALAATGGGKRSVTTMAHGTSITSVAAVAFDNMVVPAAWRGRHIQVTLNLQLYRTVAPTTDAVATAVLSGTGFDPTEMSAVVNGPVLLSGTYPAGTYMQGTTFFASGSGDGSLDVQLKVNGENWLISAIDPKKSTCILRVLEAT